MAVTKTPQKLHAHDLLPAKWRGLLLVLERLSVRVHAGDHDAREDRIRRKRRFIRPELQRVLLV